MRHLLDSRYLQPKLRRLAWPTNLFYRIWPRFARKSQKTTVNLLILLILTATVLLGIIPLAHAEAPSDTDPSADISATDEENELPLKHEHDTAIDDSRLIFWSIRPHDSANTQATTQAIEVFRTGLQEVLSGELSRHLLSEKQFREHVASTSAPLPLCVIGLEPCVTPETLAFDT